jgi:allophanate hydrolase
MIRTGEMTIARLKELYASGEATPEGIVREIVRRAEADREMNIWITPPSEDMIRPYLERLRRLDPNASPLWGIPFAIKDNIDMAGVPTTAACPQYAYTPDEHAAVVQRLIDAGAIPVGKTNLDQFATGLVGTRSPYGETRNALRPELISGGSSSGSAAAVARGQAAFALGTDTAGSGRVPAALHGLVGYKPSLGAWSVRGVVPACASLDCVTVFARSAEDALLVDSVARGEDGRDPWSRRLPEPSVRMPHRILLPEETPSFYGPFAGGYAKAWKAAAERIAALGLPVRYVSVGLFEEAAALLYEGPWVAERWAALGDFVESSPGAVFPVTERVLRSAVTSGYDAASVFRARHRLQALKLEARKLLEDAVLVLPTCGGTWTREQVRENPIASNREMGRYTNHCNLLDLCAVALPAGEAETDTPFGITAFAAFDREDLIRGFAQAWTGERLEGIARAGGTPDGRQVEPPAAGGGETTQVAVCGLHMRGFPLEKQMRECGAVFVKEAATAPKYKLVKLPTTPAKPGLIKRNGPGASIRVEIWEMPVSSFGGFAASIPAPLGIGKVELEDGTEVPGFVCEAYAEAGAEDISASGGWRRAVQA